MAGPRDPLTGRFACVPTYPRLRTSACGCGGGGLHPCPISKKLRPVREKARRAYAAPRYTAQDVEEVERDLYGIESERQALRGALDDINRRVRDVGGLGERSLRGRSAAKQATRVQDLRSRNRALGKGYAARDSHGEESEQGFADLLRERAEMMAHARHLRDEEQQLTKLRRALIRATERGGRMALEERVALGYARRRSHTLTIHAHRH